MFDEVKQEASLPVQGRVDIRTLANLVEYWETNGTRIGSMSQLLSWSVELLQHLLSTNGMLPSVIESVTEANNYLIEKRLYQPGTRKRGQAKIFNAMNFESLRSKGIDPSKYVKHQFNEMHNVKSVRTPEFSEPVDNKPSVITDDMWEDAQRRIKEEEEKEKVEKKLDDSAIVEQVNTGGIDEETYNRLMSDTVEKKVVKKGDTPKPRSKEEVDQELVELEKEERAYAEKLKRM